MRNPEQVDVLVAIAAPLLVSTGELDEAQLTPRLNDAYACLGTILRALAGRKTLADRERARQQYALLLLANLSETDEAELPAPGAKPFWEFALAQYLQRAQAGKQTNLILLAAGIQTLVGQPFL